MNNKRKGILSRDQVKGPIILNSPGLFSISFVVHPYFKLTQYYIKNNWNQLRIKTKPCSKALVFREERPAYMHYFFQKLNSLEDNFFADLIAPSTLPMENESPQIPKPISSSNK